MLKELMQLKHCKNSSNINFLLIPVSVIDISEEGMNLFNKIYAYLKKQNLHKLERTPSGSIKKGRGAKLPAWDYRITNTCVELTVIYEGLAWRIQFRTKLPSGMSGRSAFTSFKRKLLRRGIDLARYAIENGAEVKKEIEKALIGAKHPINYNRVFEKVHHIDFHSSYAAGLANTHPEFAPFLNEIYHKREKKPINKSILNFSIGFMQSISGCNARWAHLSRDAIKDNNDRIKNLAETLEKKGRIVIAFNTDGIWYQGAVFHGEGEGDSLGQWRNDHINCKFRMKSAGAYEYIEKGVYTPVVRGVPNADKSSWKWGDIYEKKAKPQKFYFDEEEGISLDE